MAPKHHLVTQVMCLVSQRTQEVAQEWNACSVLLAKLEADVEEGTLAGACLDTLLALLADSPPNQQAFLAQQGLARVRPLVPHVPSSGPSISPPQGLCCNARGLPEQAHVFLGQSQL